MPDLISNCLIKKIFLTVSQPALFRQPRCFPAVGNMLHYLKAQIDAIMHCHFEIADGPLALDDDQPDSWRLIVESV